MASSDFWAWTMLLGAFQAPPTAVEPFHQEQAQFAPAIDNSSTSPSFVFVTIIDGRTKAAQSGCLPAPLLMGAIRVERGLDDSTASEAAVRREALSNPAHVFTFRDPRALAKVDVGSGGTYKQAYASACRLIQAGLPAYQADWTGGIRVGRPGEPTPLPRLIGLDRALNQRSNKD